VPGPRIRPSLVRAGGGIDGWSKWPTITLLDIRKDYNRGFQRSSVQRVGRVSEECARGLRLDRRSLFRANGGQIVKSSLGPEHPNRGSVAAPDQTTIGAQEVEISRKAEVNPIPGILRSLWELIHGEATGSTRKRIETDGRQRKRRGDQDWEIT